MKMGSKYPTYFFGPYLDPNPLPANFYLKKGKQNSDVRGWNKSDNQMNSRKWQGGFMGELKFDGKVCASCPSADCLLKCQYMDFEKDEARKEMLKVFNREESRVLQECVTCYACEEYCPRGNHPFYLIGERREEKGIYTAPRPITNQWINMTLMQGKQMVGAVKEKALSCCFIPALGELGTGEIFQEVALGHGVRGRVHVPGSSHPFRQDVGRQREASCGDR